MAKKIVDKWKTKQWYQVIAPDLFDRKTIGELVASEPEKLLNRKVPVTLDFLTGSYAMPNPYTSVKLKVTDVKGTNCYTTFVGHELAFSYVSTLVRRRRSIIHHVIKGTTRDNAAIKVKMMVVAHNKVSRQTRTDIRNKVAELINQKVSSMTLDEFLKTLFFGKMNVEIYGILKKIAPIARVEVRKTELVSTAKVQEKPVEATAQS